MTEGMQNLLIGVSSWLGGSVATGIAAYFTVMRNQLTKSEHENICDGKQQIVTIQLAQINKTLGEHGKKLDRILINGRIK
jgi:hypothetical protein